MIDLDALEKVLVKIRFLTVSETLALIRELRAAREVCGYIENGGSAPTTMALLVERWRESQGGGK